MAQPQEEPTQKSKKFPWSKSEQYKKFLSVRLEAEKGHSSLTKAYKEMEILLLAAKLQIETLEAENGELKVSNDDYLSAISSLDKQLKDNKEALAKSEAEVATLKRDIPVLKYAKKKEELDEIAKEIISTSSSQQDAQPADSQTS